MVKAIEKWSACMPDEGLPLRGAGRDRRRPEERFKAIVGAGVRPGASTPPARGASFDRARAHRSCSARRCASRTPTSTCEKQEIEPVELEVRPQYEANFRKQNRSLISQVRPVGG